MNVSRQEMADLLTQTANGIAAVLDADPPAPARSNRPYLAPLLGLLSAATPVLSTLSDPSLVS
ncbi:hypothetical protein [Streptomyces silvisoli]|uniref:Uncharacterized protein n=1 Tax=Streptomyces silvisoli TaxID=3034235 RepID=A0ABT5ZPZ1_9ACTN|nr:hypothetical protein [Streptomyces silvisoli]MDF3291897.1 hypothetical protein [Streptomyces silvisoli]